MLKFTCCASLLLMTITSCPQLLGQSKLSPADRQRLMSYVNTYNAGKLLADPVVKPQLARLVGSQLRHLETNLNVRGPIGVSGGMLTISGNAPHQGLFENGFLSVSLYNGEVYAGILSRGRIDVYGRQPGYSQLPDAVRQWAVWIWALLRLNGHAPPNVLIHPAH